MLVNDPSKFAEKFSVNSPRLKNWNYSTPGFYFITICAVYHNKFFGKIINDQMELSNKGLIAKDCLISLSKHFSNLILIDFVIMPNHIHLLLKLNEALLNSVETHDRASLQIKYQSYHFHRLAIKSNQIIPKIINQFKSSVKRICNQQHLFFAWQSRFHDEIIKDQKQYFATKQYIKNNPKSWEKDEYNK